MLLRDIDNIRLEIYLPHIPARQEGDNRVTRIVDDILVILSCLDENLKLDCLPKYVSDNPDTMPSVPLYEGDLEVLIKAIEKIKSRMDEFRSQLTAIAGEVQVLSTAKRPDPLRTTEQTASYPYCRKRTSASSLASDSRPSTTV